MQMNESIRLVGHLSAVVTRADGRKEFYSNGQLQPTLMQKFRRWMKARNLAFLFCILLIMLGAMAGPFGVGLFSFGLVTTAGVNYMAADFISGGATPTISGCKYHDSGVGTTAAAIGDTAIQTACTPAPARVVGTPSNPSANIYKSVATVAYTGTNAVTEWGLFSALTVGTMWDHRVFAAINVNSGDSIQFTYQLTIPAGGS